MNASTSIIKEILDQGPISIERYMELSLYDKSNGFYNSLEIIGKKGSFITAPEISQMFGEMLGCWVAQTWKEHGQPHPVNLVELGPGKGTLMSDIMTFMTKTCKDFIGASKIFLVEISSTFKAQQKELLKNHNPTWISNIHEIPDGFTIVIANEFFDALPIRQFVNSYNGWKEIMITVSSRGDLTFTREHISEKAILDILPCEKLGKTLLEKCPKEGIYEISVPLCQKVSELTQIISKNKGSLLIIDYGYDRRSQNIYQWKSTLQALHGHKFSDPIKNPGTSDITFHVDFGLIKELLEHQLETSNITQQGNFLTYIGIKERAENLIRHNPERGNIINMELTRLIHPAHMGIIFKVIAACSK